MCTAGTDAALPVPPFRHAQYCLPRLKGLRVPLPHSLCTSRPSVRPPSPHQPAVSPSALAAPARCQPVQSPRAKQ